MDETHWTTKIGESIRITEMSDKHLSNTIAMLERNAADQRENDITALIERYEDDIDHDYLALSMEIEDMTPREYLEQRQIYQSLLTEQRKRENQFKL